jgi:ABC-type sugar transport system substrate-binding protein
MNKRLGALTTLLVVAAVVGLFASASKSAPRAQPTIGLILPAGASQIESGALSEAAVLEDQLSVTHAGDPPTQIAAIDSLIAQHAAAIVVDTERLGGLETALLPALAEANEAGIPVLSVHQRYPGSVWVTQGSDPAVLARALADALASQMNARGQFEIVSCRRAEPAIGASLEQTKSYIRRRYPHMQLAGVAQRGIEIRHGVWSRVTLGTVLTAHPHLRGLIFLCGAAPTGLLADAYKLPKVFSVGASSWCPPLGIADAYPVSSGATELVCTADWTGRGSLAVWAANYLGGGHILTPGGYSVGPPAGMAQFLRHDSELRLLVPPLTLTKANVDQYVVRPR